MGDADYDYIVLGAGTAGCVLADRLSEDPTVSVLLVERGGPARHPGLHVPRAYRAVLDSRRFTYRYRTQPVVHGGDGEVWLRGKVVGGSSAINGMLYLRGEPEDYATLSRAGGSAWGWAQMLASFRAMEDHALGGSPLRGAGGPLPVTITEYDDELTRAVIHSADAVGIRPVDDVNATTGERIGFAPATIAGGRRISAADAFLRRARGRPNLTVLHRTRVGYLLLEGRHVSGVRIRRNGILSTVRARREVILATGAIESPLLLERSGIGSPEVLARAGIELRVPSPQVGRQLVEQRAVVVTTRVVPRIAVAQPTTVPQRLRAASRYVTSRDGPYATGDYELVAAVRASADADRPDAQFTVSSRWVASPDGGIAEHDGLAIRGYPLRPSTRSEVHVSGPTPDDPPRIEPRFLETDADRRTTAGILQRAREMLATRTMADLVIEELTPGPSVATEAQVARYALATGQGLYHAVGSCAMGPGGDHVVDEHLRVRGVSGVRVIDASIFPEVPSGGTAAPIMAAAWRAADLILRE